MLRFTTLSMLTVAGLVLLSSNVQAKSDLTQNELRVRRNQLVITDATPMCDVNLLHIRGVNLGSQKPHVTLALLPLDVLNEPVPVVGDVADLQKVVAVLPDAFCDNPASDLLTVMRTKMKYRRRWLRLTKKDLATFEVAIVGPADVPDDLADQIDQNTADIGTNAADIATNVADIAALGAGGAADPTTTYFRAAACSGSSPTLLWDSDTNVLGNCAGTLAARIQGGSAVFREIQGGSMT